MKNYLTNTEKVSSVRKLYDVERYLWVKGYPSLAKMIWRIIQLLFSCYIPPTVVLEKGVNIAHGVGIVIHQDVVVGAGTKIYQNVTIGAGRKIRGRYCPKIGKNCLLGSGCCILGGINLGDNVKVGANAVVVRDVPNGCTVVGVPAKIVKNNS